MATTAELAAVLGFNVEPRQDGDRSKYGWIVAVPEGATEEQRRPASVQEQRMWSLLSSPGVEFASRAGGQDG